MISLTLTTTPNPNPGPNLCPSPNHNPNPYPYPHPYPLLSEAFPQAFLIDDFVVVNQERSEEDMAFAIGTSVSTQILQIVSLYAPEVLHVFTHAGDHYYFENRVGLFANRGGNYSALSKTTSDNSG